MTIRDSGEPVFIPAVRTRASMIMRKRFPRSAVGTIVFSNRPPGSFTEVRPPALPMLLTESILFQPLPFGSMKSLGTRKRLNCFRHKNPVRLTLASGARRLRCAQSTTESSAARRGTSTQVPLRSFVLLSELLRMSHEQHTSQLRQVRSHPGRTLSDSRI